MGADRSQWQFPANEVGKVIGWSDEASPSNPGAAIKLVNKGPFLATANVSDAPDLSVEGDKVPTREAVRDYVDTGTVHKVADRTALAAVDMDAHTTVFVEDTADQNHWIWDGSDLSAEVSADDAGIFVPPTGGDGSTGAFVMAGARPTGSFASDQAPPARIHRLADRVFIGAGVNVDGTWNSLAKPAGLTPEASILHAWANREATVWCDAVQGKYGLVGHSQASLQDDPPEGVVTGSIGVCGFVINDSDAKPGWGGYFDAVKMPGASFTVGVEVSIANLTSESTVTPYNVKTGGANGGVAIWAQSGGGLDAAGYDDSLGTPVDAAAGMVFLSSYVDNSTKFGKGIVFDANSIDGTDGVTGTGVAIAFAKGHTITQFVAGGSVGSTILMNGSANNQRTSLVFGDNVVSIAGLSGNIVTLENGAGAGNPPANYLRAQAFAAGTSPILLAGGSDTNIDLDVRGKGTGGVVLRSGSTVQFRVNSTGIGFFGTTPVAAKTGWAVDTGTAKRTANATYSGTAEASYTQATIQTLMDAVRDATQTIKALKDDLHQTAGYGLLRT